MNLLFLSEYHAFIHNNKIIIMRATHLSFASLFSGTLFYCQPLLAPLFHRPKLKCISFIGLNTVYDGWKRHWFNGNKESGSHSWGWSVGAGRANDAFLFWTNATCKQFLFQQDDAKVRTSCCFLTGWNWIVSQMFERAGDQIYISNK